MRLKARGYSIQSTRIRAVVPVNPRAGRRFGGESRMDANGRRKAGKAKARTQKAERGVVSEHELQGLCAVAGGDGGGREGGRAESAAGAHRGGAAQPRAAEGRAQSEGGAGLGEASAVVQGVGRASGGVIRPQFVVALRVLSGGGNRCMGFRCRTSILRLVGYEPHVLHGLSIWRAVQPKCHASIHLGTPCGRLTHLGEAHTTQPLSSADRAAASEAISGVGRSRAGLDP